MKNNNSKSELEIGQKVFLNRDGWAFSILCIQKLKKYLLLKSELEIGQKVDNSNSKSCRYVFKKWK